MGSLRNGAIRRAGDRVIAALLLAIWAMSSTGRGEPHWWQAKLEAAPETARQTQKPIVLYFETELSEECARMREECFPKISAADSERFIWVRLRPEGTEKFFEFYGVHETPQILLLAPNTDEKGRLHGFVEADVLLSSLDAFLLAANDAPATETPEPPKPTHGRGEHFVFENFDARASLDDLAASGFTPIIRHTMRIDPQMGRYNSPALYVGSELKSGVKMAVNPSVALRVDLTPMLTTLTVGRGKARVAFQARAIKLEEGRKPIEIARVVVAEGSSTPPGLNATQQPPGPGSYPITLTSNMTQWSERSATTAEIDFDRQKVYVLFWVDKIGDAYVADDFIVDILPAEGTIIVCPPFRLIPDPARLAAPRPVLGGDWLFDLFDTDHDGVIRRSDIPVDMVKYFDAIDLNGDGILRLGVPEK